MRRFSTLALLAVTLCACGGPVVATQEVDHTFTTDSAPRVVVRTFNGRIHVVKGANDAVAATVTKSARGWSTEEAQKNLPHVVVTFTEDGHTITVEANRSSSTALDADGAEMSLTVPPGATLDLTTSNGDVVAEGTESRIVAETSNGAIELSAGADDIRASTSNGAVRISPLGPAIVHATSSNGDLSFHGTPGEGSSVFDTSNGSIDLFVARASAFHLDALTSNGTASCGLPMVVSGSTESTLHADVGDAPRADIRATSSNGSIRVMPLVGE